MFALATIVLAICPLVLGAAVNPRAEPSGKKGSLPLTYMKPYYLTTMKVGAAELLMIPVLSAADVEVMSKLLPPEAIGKHHVYEPSSQSEPMEGYSWNMSVSIGSWMSGPVVRDTLEAGGVSFKQPIGLIEQAVGTNFNASRQDGIIGFGFQSASLIKPKSQKSWFQDIVGQLGNPLFTTNLKKTGGSLDLGYIDSEKHKGEIDYVPNVESQKRWAVSAEWSAGTASGSIAVATLEIGSPVLALDSEAVSAYYSQIEGAEFNAKYDIWTYPCGKPLLPFGLKIGEFRKEIPASRMKFQEKPPGVCSAVVQNGSDPHRNLYMPTNSIGQPFLEDLLVVFDYGQTRIGIAESQ